MPKEYIEREELLNNLKQFAPEHLTPPIVDLVKKHPAADVVEVRHGKWIYNYNGTSICSVCGGKSSKMNFCGRCGAKMDGKDGEQ